MKRLLALLLAVMMVLSLAACGGEKDPTPSGNEEPPNQTQQQEQPSNTPDHGEDETLDNTGGDENPDKEEESKTLAFSEIIWRAATPLSLITTANN